MIHLFYKLLYKGEAYHMKLNKSAIKEVLNYVIENQTFDFNNGCMSTIPLTEVTNKLCNNNEDRRQELACALYRCISENLLESNYPNISWGVACIFDITFKGFEWLENN